MLCCFFSVVQSGQPIPKAQLCCVVLFSSWWVRPGEVCDATSFLTLNGVSEKHVTWRSHQGAAITRITDHKPYI